MGNNNDTYYAPLIDPFNSDTQYYLRVQSAHYSGGFADVTAPASANFPNNGSPTRYFVELPMAIDVSDLAGTRPMTVYNVTDTTAMTRVSGAPGAYEYRVPPSTSKWRNVIEINSAQASDVIGFDYYGIESLINAERANYIYNTFYTGATTISGTPTFSGNPILSGNPSFTGNPAFSGNITGNPTLTGDPVFSGDPTWTTSNSIQFKVKELTIGDWNMDATSFVAVAHGLTSANIRIVTAIIRDDADSSKYTLYGSSVTGSLGGYIEVNATYVNLFRTTGGIFDSTTYDSTSYNRGWIWVFYTV